VPVFEPYREALPLESGYYSFVIDDKARFRVERGNTRSHSGMVKSRMVAAAGHFWVARSGKVGKVFCTSLDYRIWIAGPNDPTVRYVINAFSRHEAFEVSPHAIFRFSRGVADSFRVSPLGKPIEDQADRERLLDEEGQGKPTQASFSRSQVEAFASHVVERPPRLYAMRDDHANNPIDFDSIEAFEFGPPRPRFAPSDGPLVSGRKAFVLDADGWLIVGHGHHLLSGGQCVGAAGQIYVDAEGLITDVNLNFSGHYRPPLSAEYARYTYRSLIHHPLLRFSPNHRISARLFFDLNQNLQNMTFSPDELILDDDRLEQQLSQIEPLNWVDDLDDELLDEDHE
jgi:hypothetical protein